MLQPHERHRKNAPPPSDMAIEQDDSRRNRPWTMDEYETLRAELRAMIRTHVPMTLNGPRRIMACFDGKAYWRVLGALDRERTADGMEER